MEKVEGIRRINACIERVFGYKARGNLTFLNISRLLKIIERERNELLLLVKNLQELVSSPFPYIAPVIPRSLLREVVRGEHFVLSQSRVALPKRGPLERLKSRSLKGPWLVSSGTFGRTRLTACSLGGEEK